MKKILLFLILSLLLAACLPQDVQMPQSPLLRLLERKSGLIAYIGADWNVYVSDQGGGNRIALTDDAVLPQTQGDAFRIYQTLAWSADGKRLGFVGISGEGDQRTSELFIANIDEEKANKVYSSATENPFYLYWSPDNQHLSFLSTAASGQTFLLQSISAESGNRLILDSGSPYYWSWAPNGKVMIVHSGNPNSTVPEHLAFLRMDTEIIEDGVEIIPASFQAPAWSPDGSRILLPRRNEQNEKEIVLLDSSGAFEKTLGTFRVSTSFAWSPDSTLVAYIDGNTPLTAGSLGTLHVVDLTTSEDFFQDEDVAAMFWSPNSRKLAYFKPFVIGTEGSDSGTQQLILQLNMLDTVSGESRELFTFRPTDQFLDIIPYIDQYHQSVTIWSPDSNNLVLSFLTDEGEAGIAVVAASGRLEPRLLAPGYLAFWSWR
ncbi:MAG TPA: hypothetical protein VNK49_10515 [Anaerolineales bacterium]|nr:hypothetical protein [Anaerolineales bacterium]